MAKKRKEPYFAEREEQAVVDYILSTSKEEKDTIYNEILIEPFKKMIQSILRRYPIHIGNYEMEEVEEDALTHLIEHMVKYRSFIIESKKSDGTEDKWTKMDDEHRFIYLEDAQECLRTLIIEDDDYLYKIFNSKAYSYCQTIIRNFYKDWSKRTNREKIQNLAYDDYIDEVNRNAEYSYELDFDEQNKLENLINSVVDEIEEMIEDDVIMKKNEIVVGNAIINILRNWHFLFMEETHEGKYNKKVTNKFAKNKILLYLKEQTGLSTKEIRVGIKPFKEIYFLRKIDHIYD